MNYPKMEAGQALVAGLKSPELVAGRMYLLSLYPVPSARWEEDRGWLIGRSYTVLFYLLPFVLGMRLTHATTRMATDPNLHHSLTARATNEQQARELANRVRIWINCFDLDCSTSTQFGKPSTNKENYIARHTMFWCRQSGLNYDIHLCGYTQMLRVMARFHEAIYSDPDAPTGLNKVGWVSFCAGLFSDGTDWLYVRGLIPRR
jgi:Fungal specific transcription factor domain